MQLPNVTMMAETTSKKQSGRRWPKGTSGNPRGRPQGARHKALQALDAIGEEHATAILKAVVEAAQGGDLRAAEILLRRLWPERKGRPVVLDLPAVTDATGVQAALTRIVAAAADGEITPDEASVFAALIEMQRHAIEIVEFEERLRVIEERIATNEND